MMTRAERRRMERESGGRTTYQFTLEQIEAMKRQAVLDAKEIVKEVNRICGDENADIRKYRDETYELYGVKYEVK